MSRMEFTHLGTYALMAVFAIGVLGCAITVPVCAFKFFRVLAEKDSPEEESAMSAPLAQPEALPTPNQPAAMRPAPAGQPSPPVPQAATPDVVTVNRPDHPRQRPVVPKRNRRPRGTAGN